MIPTIEIVNRVTKYQPTMILKNCKDLKLLIEKTRYLTRFSSKQVKVLGTLTAPINQLLTVNCISQSCPTKQQIDSEFRALIIRVGKSEASW